MYRIYLVVLHVHGLAVDAPACLCRWIPTAKSAESSQRASMQYLYNCRSNSFVQNRPFIFHRPEIPFVQPWNACNCFLRSSSLSALLARHRFGLTGGSAALTLGIAKAGRARPRPKKKNMTASLSHSHRASRVPNIPHRVIIARLRALVVPVTLW